jgi:hypothetical protein
MSLTDFKAKMNKSKINKYKINNNNKTNTKHEFNVKYERSFLFSSRLGRGRSGLRVTLLD